MEDLNSDLLRLVKFELCFIKVIFSEIIPDNMLDVDNNFLDTQGTEQE